MEKVAIILEIIQVTGRVLFPFFVAFFAGAFIVGYRDYLKIKE